MPIVKFDALSNKLRSGEHLDPAKSRARV